MVVPEIWFHVRRHCGLFACAILKGVCSPPRCLPRDHLRLRSIRLLTLSHRARRAASEPTILCVRSKLCGLAECFYQTLTNNLPFATVSMEDRQFCQSPTCRTGILSSFPPYFEILPGPRSMNQEALHRLVWHLSQKQACSLPQGLSLTTVAYHGSVSCSGENCTSYRGPSEKACNLTGEKHADYRR